MDTYIDTYVSGSLNYIVPQADRPVSYMYAPPPGVPELSATYEPRSVTIRSMRPFAPQLSLDKEGFRLVDHTSRVTNFYDETEVRTVHYPEVEKLDAETTGASRVVIFDHTVRRRAWNDASDPTNLNRVPVQRIHN